MPIARILTHGLLPCFPAGLCDEDGEPVNAEVSAVVAYDGSLLLASDKPVPGENRSSVFSVRCVNHFPIAETLEYVTDELIMASRKFEDFALTPGGRHLLASTGFDRIDTDSTSHHQYNNLLIWPRRTPEQAKIVAASEVEGVISSVAIRRHLQEVLGAPYFKIEGLAAIPGRDGGDDRLLFGIREVGTDYANFDYARKLIGVPYRITDDQMHFTGDFCVDYDFDPSGVEGVRFTIGLSSLEYDPYNHRLLLLTSFETEDDRGAACIGGYLWVASMDDLAAGRPPALVRDQNGAVLEFVNKAEGIAALDAKHVFVVYDEDRNTALAAHKGRNRREPHEAPYSVLALE